MAAKESKTPSAEADHPEGTADAGAVGVAALTRQLAERDARIDELGKLSEEREAEWRRLLGKRDKRIVTLNKRVAHRDKRLAEAKEVAESATVAKRRAEEELVRMQQTWSWRLTAPLRAIPALRNRPPKADAAPAAEPIPEAPPPNSEWEIGMMKTPEVRRSRRQLGRMAVFTAVIGGYDTVREPTVIDPAADYFLFTDGEVPAGSVWQKRSFDFAAADATRMARFVKTHPHRYFPEHDWSIWMDGNLRLAALPEDFVSEENADGDIIAWHHPDRDCVYDELEECLALDKDDPAVMRQQIARLRASGYPEHSGLITSCMMVYRHRRAEVAALLDDWWEMIESGSRRDQLSFNPALRNHPGITLRYLAPRGVEMHNDPRVLYGHHRQAKGAAETDAD